LVSEWKYYSGNHSNQLEKKEGSAKKRRMEPSRKKKQKEEEGKIEFVK